MKSAATSGPTGAWDRSALRGPLAVATYLALLKLVVHLAVSGYFAPHFGYGFFDDEFYYLECGRRLAWGYVDQPPVVAVAAKAALLMGGSLFAVRLIPALAGALTVLLTGMVARELGARALGVAIACGCVVAAPAYLFDASLLSMNVFEPVLWLAMTYFILRMINGGDPRWWLAVGAATGIALLNKYTVLAFIFALLLGLLLSPARSLLRTRWFALAVVIATALALPNFLWQWHHGWPMIVYQKAQRAHGAPVDSAPLIFLFAHALQLGLLTAGYWLAGLAWLCFGPSAKRYRAFGWAYLFTAAVFLLTKGKSYYLLPAGAMLYAAGGAATDLIARQRGRTWWPVPAALCVIGFVLSAPFVLPAFPLAYEEQLMQRWGSYIRIGSQPQPRILPQFAEMMGWREMAEGVGSVYASLPTEERARTAVLATTYQRAGALDYYRAQYRLPQVLGIHQTYFLWGTQGFRGDSLLLVGPPPPVLLEQCGQVRQVGIIDNAYANPDTNGPILLCSGLKRPLEEIWPQLRRWN